MAKGEPKKAGCKHFCFLWTTADVREISTSRRQRESGRESWSVSFRDSGGRK